MNFLFLLKIYVIKVIIFIFEKIFNKGSSFPGKIALKLDKDILKKISFDYNIIVVTGTNGKTTTTNMIYKTLINANINAITNSSGANMTFGIITCFIKNFKLSSKNKKNIYAVLEVDESYIPIIKNHLNINYLVVTNLFRDQTDRHVDYHIIFDKIMSATIENKNIKLILNADCSIFCGLNIENEISYYGFSKELSFLDNVNDNEDFKFCKFCNTKYKYKSVTYAYLGHFYCENCNFERNELKYSCENIEEKDSFLRLKFNDDDVVLNAKGIHNIYNALCCYSLCKEINIDTKTINKTLSFDNTIPFGRYQTINIYEKNLIMSLVKNPSGFNLLINNITNNTEEFNCFLFLNDNEPDGIDISWIYDVNFENLQNSKIQNIYVLGKRKYDLMIRLNPIFKLDETNVCENLNHIIQIIKDSKTKNNYLFTNYTSMLEFRKFLMSKGYIKTIW